MRINSNIPKTFSIYVEKDGKCGFIRFRSSQDSNGEMRYSISIVPKHTEASKFVNFDNVKKTASSLMERHRFDEAKVLDDKLMKYYYVKNKKSKES